MDIGAIPRVGPGGGGGDGHRDLHLLAGGDQDRSARADNGAGIGPGGEAKGTIGVEHRRARTVGIGQPERNVETVPIAGDGIGNELNRQVLTTAILVPHHVGDDRASTSNSLEAHLVDDACLAVGPGLEQPVEPGDAAVHHPLLDVARHLLRPDQDALDLGVVDGRVVRAARDLQVVPGLREERARGFLKTSLGQADTQPPLGRSVAEAEEMNRIAQKTGAITMVPFTYHWMPVNRWVRQLVEEGWVGQPLHANLRYYTSFGFDTGYSWRFDKEIAGSGIIGDIGSHFIHLSRWLLGDTETSISAHTSTFVERGPRPDGTPYEPLEDSAALTVRYATGAYSCIQVSSVCWEGDGFGQSHHLEIHGTEGTIYATCDWDRIQEVSGLRKGDPRRQPLPIPDDIWGDLRRDTVHNTYRDVFRTTDSMTRGWITAMAAGEHCKPDFAEGLAVQRVIDAAVDSANAGGCPIDLS